MTPMIIGFVWLHVYFSGTKVFKVAGITNLQVSLVGFQKFFWFWVTGIILEGWDVKIDRAHSFVIISSKEILYLGFLIRLFAT